MSVLPWRRLVLAAPALALAACSHGPGKGGEARPETIQPISNAQQIGDVIALLDRGEEKAARKALEAMLKREPGDARAKLLLSTITDDPKTLLGEQSFAYTVKPGETMSDLAARYLGNSDKFYALARYNGIPHPADLEAGQEMRIPGEAPKPTPPPRAEPRRTPKPSRPPAAAPKPQPKTAAPARPAADPARAGRLRAAGLAALNQGKVDRAVMLLRQAAMFDPGSALIQRDLGRAQRIQWTVKARR